MNFSGDFSTQEEENEREEKKQESEEKRSKFLSVVYPGYSTFFFFFLFILSLVISLFHITAIVSATRLRDYNHFRTIFDPLDLTIYYLTC